MIMTTIWLSSQLACWCVTRCCCALNFVWRSIEGDLSRVVWFSDCWTMIQHDPTMQHRGLGLFFSNHFFPEPLNFHCEPQIFCSSISDRSLTDTSSHEARSPLSTLWTLSARVSWRSSLGSESGPQQRTVVFFVLPKKNSKNTRPTGLTN